MDTFTETLRNPHQPVGANNFGYQGPSAIPETVQQYILGVVVTSSSENSKKSRKRRIPEYFTVYYLTVIPLVKVSSFLVRSQNVRHGASGDQQVSLRKYGGMRN